MTRSAEPDRPVRTGYLLLPDFAMMSYAAATEPLRAANRLSGRTLYAWRLYSLDGRPALASSGAALMVDGAVGEEAHDLDRLFVCAGGNPAAFDHAPTFAWLRGLARRGVAIGGISGGPFVLARAGLLAGRRSTIHWEHLPAYLEAFPALAITGTVFELDGDRMTSAGGVAALDMMIALIERDHGRPLALAVGDWYLRREPGAADAAQRIGPGARFPTADPRLLRVIARLEADPVAPPSRAALARLAGLSLRRLETLFRAAVGTTIARHVLALRLDRARGLIEQSRLPVIEVATTCGFQSAAHFSRAYKARFGAAPRHDRSRRAGPAPATGAA